MHEQGSHEWRKDRLGVVTASRMADVMAQGRSGKPSATRANYMAQLVSERLTGVPVDGFKSEAMQRGNDTEDQARSCYVLDTGNTVDQVGFIPHPHITGLGASPDGLVEADGLIEIKCPHTATHIDTLRNGSIGRAYMLQMQTQMACLPERQWVDFVSFDPRMPDELRIKIIRVDRDPQVIADIELAAETFIKELDALEAELRQMTTE